MSTRRHLALLTPPHLPRCIMPYYVHAVVDAPDAEDARRRLESVAPRFLMNPRHTYRIEAVASVEEAHRVHIEDGRLLDEAIALAERNNASMFADVGPDPRCRTGHVDRDERLPYADRELATVEAVRSAETPDRLARLDLVRGRFDQEDCVGDLRRVAPASSDDAAAAFERRMRFLLVTALHDHADAWPAKVRLDRVHGNTDARPANRNNHGSRDGREITVHFGDGIGEFHIMLEGDDGKTEPENACPFVANDSEKNLLASHMSAVLNAAVDVFGDLMPDTHTFRVEPPTHHEIARLLRAPSAYDIARGAAEPDGTDDWERAT